MRLHALLVPVLLTASALSAQNQRPAAADTPEAVAEKYVAAMRAHNWRGMAALMHPAALAKFRGLIGAAAKSERGAQLRQNVFGGATAAQLDSLSDGDFYAKFIEAAMGQSPELQSVLDSAAVQVIGHVNESPTLTHVVFNTRLTLGQIAVTKPDVITLQRSGNAWLMLLRADLEVMAAAIRQQFGS